MQYPVVLQPFTLAICALSIYWAYLGLGQRFIYVDTSLIDLDFLLFMVYMLYVTGLTLVKLSVLLFYVRVFRTVQAYRVAFWIVGLIVVAWCVAQSFVALLACIPIQSAWDSSIPGRCVSMEAASVGSSVTDILTDFILLVLPVPMVWNLQISFRRKIGVVGVFIAGYL